MPRVGRQMPGQSLLATLSTHVEIQAIVEHDDAAIAHGIETHDLTAFKAPHDAGATPMA